MTNLMSFISGHNEELVRLILEHHELNVNLRGMDGYTALIRACADRPDFVRLILAVRPDVDVNLATYYGTTALTCAIRCGNEEAVQYLLMRGDIDVNYQSRHCENALLEALAYRRDAIARALIVRGDVSVDVLDGKDRTPLILSVQYGYLPLVRMLLFDACADVSAEDEYGNNALYYALKRGANTMVHDIVEVMSVPQPLTRICRTVIRRVIRSNLGYGHRLKPQIDRFPKHELPTMLRKFLAYDP